MFADTGIPLLFKSCYKLGAEKKRMVIKVAGGARIMDDMNYFRIGEHVMQQATNLESGYRQRQQQPGTHRSPDNPFPRC